MPRVWICRWCHETVRETNEAYVVINDDTGETVHATCYDDHHVAPEQKAAEAAHYEESQAQVDRDNADLEARKIIRTGFEETLIHQQNWRDEKSVEFPDDWSLRNLRRWDRGIPPVVHQASG